MTPDEHRAAIVAMRLVDRERLFPFANEMPICGANRHGSPYVCTRLEGHTGSHAAHGMAWRVIDVSEH